MGTPRGDHPPLGAFDQCLRPPHRPAARRESLPHPPRRERHQPRPGRTHPRPLSAIQHPLASLGRRAGVTPRKSRRRASRNNGSPPPERVPTGVESQCPAVATRSGPKPDAPQTGGTPLPGGHFAPNSRSRSEKFARRAAKASYSARSEAIRSRTD